MNMITCVKDLAHEVGCRSSDFATQAQEIQRAVKKHTDYAVWVKVSPSRIIILNSVNSNISDALYFPFTTEDFWKSVEWVEMLEEDDDIYDDYDLADDYD